MRTLPGQRVGAGMVAAGGSLASKEKKVSFCLVFDAVIFFKIKQPLLVSW